MKYSEFFPDRLLQPYIECYWIVEGNSDVTTQKIVPDGFTEIVFHFGDLYRFRNYRGEERIQSRCILAGQITQPVYLTPTGKSGVLGIKFKPTGIWKLFGWEMNSFTDKAVDLMELPRLKLNNLIDQLVLVDSNSIRVELVEQYLLNQRVEARATIVDNVANEITVSNGIVSINELCEKFSLSPRKLERMFNEQVGISAKRYARLVRFRHVFQLLKKEEWNKAEATYLAGYFDQAHFNKEFKTFSGEDPRSYFAQHHEFANFFMDRTVVFLQDFASSDRSSLKKKRK